MPINTPYKNHRNENFPSALTGVCSITYQEPKFPSCFLINNIANFQSFQRQYWFSQTQATNPNIFIYFSDNKCPLSWIITGMLFVCSLGCALKRTFHSPFQINSLSLLCQRRTFLSSPDSRELFLLPPLSPVVIF